MHLQEQSGKWGLGEVISAKKLHQYTFIYLMFRKRCRLPLPQQGTMGGVPQTLHSGVHKLQTGQRSGHSGKAAYEYPPPEKKGACHWTLNESGASSSGEPGEEGLLTGSAAGPAAAAAVPSPPCVVAGSSVASKRRTANHRRGTEPPIPAVEHRGPLDEDRGRVRAAVTLIDHPRSKGKISVVPRGSKAN